MTAKQLLDRALALLLTDASQTPEYAESALPLTNLLLGELHIHNNVLRQAKGLGTLCAPMEIAAMEEALPCEPELAAAALPYGLCAKLLMDDDDMAKVAWFQNQFVMAACDAAGSHAAPVVDHYGGGAQV